MLCRLLNRKNLPEDNYEHFQDGIDGIIISATYLTPLIVEKAHNAGKFVGVWISRGNSVENEELYHKVFSLKVDFFYLDIPIKGMEYRNQNY